MKQKIRPPQDQISEIGKIIGNCVQELTSSLRKYNYSDLFVKIDLSRQSSDGYEASSTVDVFKYEKDVLDVERWTPSN